MRNAHARVALLTFVLASTSCSWRHARPHALLRLRMALAPAVVPADHPIAVDGAAPLFSHPRADADDHDLGERFAARPLPLPAAHVGQTRRFQFDGFRRGWVAQFDHDALLQTPAFANGKVFVGAGFHSTTVYALDAESGDLRWVGATPDGGPTAAIVDDDKVLFNTESCTLFAFDARNGRSLWSHYLGDPLMSQPAASHGLVYSAYPDSGAPNGFSFAAMSMRNGEFVWRIPIRADVLTAPVIDGSAVYFTTMNGVAYRVDAHSGRVRWTRGVSATSAPSVREGVVYLSQRAAHATERQIVLEQVAEVGRGEATAVTPSEDPAVAADRFATLLDRPFLTDVRIDWNGLAVHDVYPRYVPDLYAGRPVLVHGRFDRAGTADVRVSGFIGSSPWSRSVHVVLPERARDHEALPSVWARARVKDLSRALVLGETDALREEIAQLGLTYHLVTAYTSFVAVDESGGDAARCGNMPVTTGSAFGYGGLGMAGVGYGVLGSSSQGSGYGVARGLTARITVTVPIVRTAPPVVRRLAAPEPIRATVLRNISQVRMCYQSALQRHPTLEGRVTVRFVIGADGAVAAAAVADSTITDPSVGECIVAAARLWIFAAPPDGLVVTVNYPFAFSAAEPAERPTRFDVPRDL